MHGCFEDWRRCAQQTKAGEAGTRTYPAAPPARRRRRSADHPDTPPSYGFCLRTEKSQSRMDFNWTIDDCSGRAYDVGRKISVVHGF